MGFRSKDDIFPVRVATKQVVINPLAKGTGIGVGDQTINKGAGFFPPGTAYRIICQCHGQFGQKTISMVVSIQDDTLAKWIWAGLAQPRATSPQSVRKDLRFHIRSKLFI